MARREPYPGFNIWGRSMTAKEDKLLRILRAVYDDIPPDSGDGFCPYCNRKFHRAYCVLPYIKEALNMPLNEADKKFFEEFGDV